MLQTIDQHNISISVWAKITHHGKSMLMFYKIDTKPFVIRPSWFNSLAPERYLELFLWICSQVNATGPYLWSVNIGSGNGLGPSGNKPLPEAITWTNVDQVLWCHMASLRHNELTYFKCGYQSLSYQTRCVKNTIPNPTISYPSWFPQK